MTLAEFALNQPPIVICGMTEGLMSTGIVTRFFSLASKLRRRPDNPAKQNAADGAQGSVMAVAGFICCRAVVEIIESDQLRA